MILCSIFGNGNMNIISRMRWRVENIIPTQVNAMKNVSEKRKKILIRVSAGRTRYEFNDTSYTYAPKVKILLNGFSRKILVSAIGFVIPTWSGGGAWLRWSIVRSLYVSARMSCFPFRLFHLLINPDGGESRKRRTI